MTLPPKVRLAIPCPLFSLVAMPQLFDRFCDSFDTLSCVLAHQLGIRQCQPFLKQGNLFVETILFSPTIMTVLVKM